MSPLLELCPHPSPHVVPVPWISHAATGSQEVSIQTEGLSPQNELGGRGMSVNIYTLSCMQIDGMDSLQICRPTDMNAQLNAQFYGYEKTSSTRQAPLLSVHCTCFNVRWGFEDAIRYS